MAPQVQAVRGVAVVDAAVDAAVRRQPGAPRDPGADRSQDRVRRPEGWEQPLPSPPLHQGGKAPLPGIPEVAVAADRGQLARGNPGQPPGPVLGVGEDAVGAGELLGEVALQPEQLAAEVHPRRQGGAAGLGERGSHLGECFGSLLRRLGLVVEDGQGEPVSAHQGGGAAVGRRHDGVDRVPAR